MDSHFWITDPSDQQIHVRVWQPQDDMKARGVVQIVHGMAEHIERYAALASYLNLHGYWVYGHDHRGHGKTSGSIEKLGDFGDDDGWRRLVENTYDVTSEIRRRHPELKIHMFAHSMGSYVARCFITQFSRNIDGLILTGIGFQNPIVIDAGKQIGKLCGRIFGEGSDAPFMDRLAFHSYNRKVRNPHTPFDWLCSDAEQVETYIRDPYCGWIGSHRFYVDLARLIRFSARRDKADGIRKDLPIAIFSGLEDPVGDYGKSAGRLYGFLKDAGIVHLTYRVYPAMRHELQNEVKRTKFFEDVLNKLHTFEEL